MSRQAGSDFLDYGSAGRTRTYNQWINSRLLYQLSYRGRVPAGVGKATSRVFLA